MRIQKCRFQFFDTYLRVLPDLSPSGIHFFDRVHTQKSFVLTAMPLRSTLNCVYILMLRTNNTNIRRISDLNENINVDSLNTLVICNKLPDNTCSICLDEYKEDDILVKLNCNHIFHKDCLEPWFNDNNKNCPLCRGGV